ncbi:lytic transglycosylase domain-containing protein [Paenibacillus koleovorans]|uniref:lytic transglycosylase domain-containing protein n=1 Tax=Paenibacillus koleovorans TaxID=121608 RepID=UPI000FD86CBE|nr:lytic transglycosylase domain-containing protein [Paenibacillus koleovorans]
MNGIDPRYLKQLLQAQLKPDLDGMLANKPASEGGFDFAGMLSTLLETMDESNAAKSTATTAAEQPLGLQRLAYMLPQLSKTTATNDFDAIVEQASLKYGVDAALIHSVIQAESGYRPNVVSSAGAKGLMQLMDGTAKSLGVSDSFDPIQNVEGGTKYLASLLQRYNGNAAMALAAYNAGPGRVDALGVRNDEQLKAKLTQLPLETQKYVAKILGALQP